MKSKVLKDNAAFYEKEFRDDLSRLISQPPQIVEDISRWIESRKSLRDFLDEDMWIPLLKGTGQTVEQMRGTFEPLLHIARTAANEKISIEDLADEMAEEGILTDKNAHRALVIRLVDPIVALVLRATEELGPQIPMFQISSMTTRCIAVSEFENEFSVTKDEPSTYSPLVNRLHRRITLDLRLNDEKTEKNIG